MSCQICGRRSAPGAKLCADCRAARKRAYDATITQPLLAMAGAGTISRTLSRLRRSTRDSSPEAKARRAARKAKAAADAAPRAVVSEPAAPAAARSRSILWTVLAIGVVLAAIAGWHLPTHAPDVPEVGAGSSAAPAAPAQPAPGAEPARMTPSATLPPASALAPLPTIVERELIPNSHAAGKPATTKRSPAPKAAATPPPEAPAEVEIVRAPPAEPAPPVRRPVPRADPWQQMSEAIASCPAGFLGRVVCEQRVRLQYCEGQWGKVPQCPGGPSADHD
jgi:hypothetical protein